VPLVILLCHSVSPTKLRTILPLQTARKYAHPQCCKPGMSNSNSNCCAARIISLNVEKIVSGPQMKKYPIFLSVLTALFSDQTVSIEGFEYFDHFKSKKRRFGEILVILCVI
jgi:hypothetical protein